MDGPMFQGQKVSTNKLQCCNRVPLYRGDYSSEL